MGTHTKTNGVACMIRHGGGGSATVKGSVERVGVHKRACNGKGRTFCLSVLVMVRFVRYERWMQERD